MEIKFLGATREVTGSKHLLIGKEHNILIDCGLYQGEEAKKKNENIENLLNDEKIDAIILTHAHLDHCGYIPKLYKDGFRGPIFCTPQTYDIARIVMSDNARIQSIEAKKQNKDIKKDKDKIIPMYTQTHVNQALANFDIRNFSETFNWHEYQIKFKKAGHILGAASPVISTLDNSIQFSGDLGRADDYTIYPPAAAEQVNTLVIESTYGNRVHLDENLSESLKALFSEAKKKSSAIIMPAFSVGRSQTLMKILYDFFENNPELNLPVFVDSPMTQEVTKLYYKYPNDHKVSQHILNKIEHKFHFIHYKSEKERLDKMQDAHIILTASGMLSGGNVLHHLALKGSDENNLIMITGYQSPGTLGHNLLEGSLTHSLEGNTLKINAKVIHLKNLSSHADHDALIQWAKGAYAKKIFITHGEESAKVQLEKDLKEITNSEVIIPTNEDKFSI